MSMRPSGDSIKIKVFGVGGGGGNAVRRMAMEAGARDAFHDVDFYILNTDADALLDYADATKKWQNIQLGPQLTQGQGAGGNPEVGFRAAEESRDEILHAMTGADMVFIATGLGGGTGTGASPVVAEIARNLGVLTVATVTMPFEFEGERRMRLASEGRMALKGSTEPGKHLVDTIITIPNQKLIEIEGGKGMKLKEAHRAADNVLAQAVQGIVEIMDQTGLVNVDFNDVCTVLSQGAHAMVGIGEATGDAAVMDATRAASMSPLLEVPIRGAGRVLVNYCGDSALGLHQISESAEWLRSQLREDADFYYGVVCDDAFQNKVRVTVVAAGYEL